MQITIELTDENYKKLQSKRLEGTLHFVSDNKFEFHVYNRPPRKKKEERIYKFLHGTAKVDKDEVKVLVNIQRDEMIDDKQRVDPIKILQDEVTEAADVISTFID